MAIDDPIKEHKFKSIISVVADTREDALNILNHLESKSVGFDIIVGFGEGESNYVEQLPLKEVTLPSGLVAKVGSAKSI